MGKCDQCGKEAKLTTVFDPGWKNGKFCSECNPYSEEKEKQKEKEKLEEKAKKIKIAEIDRRNKELLIKQLFKNPLEFKSLQNVPEGYYLFNYHPKHVRKDEKIIDNPLFDQISDFVLDIKNSENGAINKTINQLNNSLGNLNLFTICIVPPSDSLKIDSGVRIIAKKLCENGALYGIECIKRKYTIPPQHKSSSRLSVDELKASLIIKNEDLIKNKNILLFDDISTSGRAFESARQLLLEKGAKRVVCIALAQTSYDHDN